MTNTSTFFARLLRRTDRTEPIEDALSQTTTDETSVGSRSPIAGPSILVAGGIVVDFLFEVNSWPQPGEAVSGLFRPIPGGKGLNQATACARLGVPTFVVSAVGNDTYGGWLLDILAKEGVNLHVFQEDTKAGDTVTDVTAVMLSEGKPRYVGCRKASEHLTTEFVDGVTPIINQADVVTVTLDVKLAAITRVVQIARAAHKHIIVNVSPPDPFPLTMLDSVDYVVLNEQEARKWLAQVAPHEVSEQLDHTSPADLAKIILDNGALHVAMITDTRGCTVFSQSGAKRYRSFKIDQVVDRAGASSAFCAGLAFAIATEQSSYEQIRFASAALALACTKIGAHASMPTIESIQRFLDEHRDEEIDFNEAVFRLSRMTNRPT